MSAKPSLGPWMQGGLDKQDPHWLCDIRDVNGGSIGWCGSFPREQAHANARLMAAAPELLAALKTYVAAHAIPSNICKERAAYEAAVAIIAKAESQP